MKKQILYSGISLLLGTVLMFQDILPAAAQTVSGSDSYIEEAEAEYVLSPSVEEAAEAFEKITDEKDILALVYLCDAYDMKKEANANSETVTQVSSGTTVHLKSVSEDRGKNIWYQVELVTDSEILTGYIEKDNLIYVDEELSQWEADYVTSTRVMFRNFFAAAPSTTTEDIERFPDSYKEALYKLKSAHPNWVFVPYNTGRDWNQMVLAQCQGNRSLIYASTSIEEWKNGMYDKTWAIASPGIVKYYLDPRNSLTENTIFQFELLSYNSNYHSRQAVQTILDNTFMSAQIEPGSKTYAETFVEIGIKNQVSPLLLASRVRQEQGVAGSSPLISGTYAGYEGFYNYYNIGASGNTTQQVVTSGLKKAKEQGWNSRDKSLAGGAAFLSSSYIKRGQDTLYLQKFDVVNYYHQYMQNIQAPTQEAKTTRKGYETAGIIQAPFVFRIPVYTNMPAVASPKPSKTDQIALSTGTITNLPVGQNASLTGYINGNAAPAGALIFASADTAIATVDNQGKITGVTPGTVTVSVTKENATTATCSVTVIKADTTQYTIPELGEITYDPAKTLADVSLESGWKWVNVTQTPTVDNVGYTATYTPDDTRYNPVTVTVPLKVKKATPVVSGSVAGLEGAAGTELSYIPLPAGYSWKNPGEKLPDKIGDVVCQATYNPDETNYETLTGVEITVKVICAGHEFDEWTGTDPTCTESGHKERTCSICGYVDIEDKSALGHDVSETITSQPSHEQAGEKTIKCNRTGCTYSVTEKIPQQEHSYTETITKQPTCTSKGEKTFTCACGDKHTEEIPMTAHSYTETVTKQPTCTSKGEKTFTCACGDKHTEEIPMTAHSYTETVTKQPTCTQEGEKSLTCSVCKAGYTEKIKALGHNYVNGVCSRCKEKDPNYKAPVNNTQTPSNTPTVHTHSYAATVTTQPDCTHRGVKTYQCSCGASYTEEIAATGHIMENGKCSRCGYEDPALKKQGVTPNIEKLPATKTETNIQTNVDEKKEDEKKEENKVYKLDMEHATELTINQLSKIQGKEENLQLNMGNDVTWVIKGSSVKEGIAQPIDMAVTVGSDAIPQKTVESIAQDYEYLGVSLAYEGEFGFEADLTLKADKVYINKTANMFYYNPDSENFEFIGKCVVQKDGTMTFGMSHASDYVIIFADSSMEDVVAKNQTEEITEAKTEELGEQAEESKVKEIEPSTLYLDVIIPVMLILAALIGGIAIVVALRKPKRKNSDEEGYDEF